MQVSFTTALIPDSIERVRVPQECIADCTPRSNGVEQLLRDIDRMLARTDTTQRMAHDVQAQLPIALKLCLRKELVGRGLVRERGMGGVVLGNSNILITGKRRLQVNKISDAPVAVFDRSHSRMGKTMQFFSLTDGPHIQVDLGTKVSRTDANEITQGAKLKQLVTLAPEQWNIQAVTEFYLDQIGLPDAKQFLQPPAPPQQPQVDPAAAAKAASNVAVQNMKKGEAAK